MIFFQLLLGGLLTFNFISVGVHIVIGIITLILAFATMIVAIFSKPRPRSLLIPSIALVLLIVVQIVLGFDTLSTGSQLVAWIHFVNAMAIYGVAMSGTFVASRMARPEKPLIGAK